MSHSLSELAAVTTAAFDYLGAAYTGQVSYNFLRGDQQERVPAAFGKEKYSKLEVLKKKFDPANLFRFNLNIPPAK